MAAENKAILAREGTTSRTEGLETMRIIRLDVTLLPFVGIGQRRDYAAYLQYQVCQPCFKMFLSAGANESSQRKNMDNILLDGPVAVSDIPPHSSCPSFSDDESRDRFQAPAWSQADSAYITPYYRTHMTSRLT